MIPRLAKPTAIALIAWTAISAQLGWGQTVKQTLEKEPVNWSSWEDDLSAEKKRAIWEQLPQQIVDIAQSSRRHFRYRKESIEPIDLIHVFDFSGDGVDDVVLEGQLGESEVFYFVQSIDGQFKTVLQKWGVLTGLYRAAPWLPVSLRLYNYGCCADRRDFVEDYVPATGDSLRFVLSGRTVLIHGTQLPSADLTVPILFSIEREVYNLRLAPKIDDEPRDGPDGKWPGNLIARYAKGTRGIALAEETDDTGRIWWFVLIKAQELPQWVLHDGHKGINSEVPADRFGWMSSRYLQKID